MIIINEKNNIFTFEQVHLANAWDEWTKNNLKLK